MTLPEQYCVIKRSLPTVEMTNDDYIPVKSFSLRPLRLGAFALKSQYVPEQVLRILFIDLGPGVAKGDCAIEYQCLFMIVPDEVTGAFELVVFFRVCFGQ